MNKIIAIILTLSAFLMLGCGSNTTTYEKEKVGEDLQEIPNDGAIIVEGGESITVTSSAIIVDCGEGGCGDVSIGTEVGDDSDSSDNSDGSTCSGGNCPLAS